MIGVITDVSDLITRTDRLEKELKIDSFTGLYTKTHAIDLIKDILHKERGQKHVLMLLDLDNFKSVNDTLGHMTGDRVLKAESDNLKKLFRKNDVLGRFGGDEFIILLKDVSDRGALCRKLDALLKNTSDHCMVTKSVGISVFPDDAVEFSALFGAADKALYEAKKGKNRYILFSDLTDRRLPR